MKKTNTIENKSESRQAIFRYILQHQAATRQDLFINLGISLPTIKSVLEHLLDENLIQVSGQIKNTGGRNAVTYSMNPDGYIALGVYISHHHLTAVSVNMLGRVICTQRERITMDLHDADYLKKIGQLVETVKTMTMEALSFDNENSPSPSPILGVGIAIPSMVSQDGESILFGMTHDYSDINREVISTYIKEPTFLYHDSYAAGFAEVWLTPNLQNSIYLNLNNTVGSCLILDGKIFSGNNCRAGEFGHILVEPRHGKTCYCGRKGCLDTVCNTMILEDMAQGSLQEFFDKLNDQDPLACRLWADYVEYLAIAIHNSRMMFDASFIIGGSLGCYIGDHIEDIYNKVDEYRVFSTCAREYIHPCTYRVGATAAGAALGIIDRHISRL